MAVTKSTKLYVSNTLGMLLAAGNLLALDAYAATPPEKGAISLKYLDYNDWQPGKDRISVHAPSINIVSPINGDWSINASAISDVISGASPAYHTNRITKMNDHRQAGDLTVTRYFSRGTLSFGTSLSSESDYLSRGYSMQGTVESESKNTVLNFGVAVANDAINPTFGGVHEKKRIFDGVLGVTQVLTKNDIGQINFRYSQGTGYFSDPYKWLDNRPESRDQRSVALRWNHHFDDLDATSKVNYRYYNDTWNIKSHTLSIEYIQPLTQGWTISPLARFYTQNEANFYVASDPASGSGPTFPSEDAKYYSLDQRLSSFGALTVGFKISKMIQKDWVLDFKYERYEQKAHWALWGNEDKGLEDFSARSLQFGITKFF